MAAVDMEVDKAVENVAAVEATPSVAEPQASTSTSPSAEEETKVIKQGMCFCSLSSRAM
jgi:hypothetical protein